MIRKESKSKHHIIHQTAAGVATIVAANAPNLTAREVESYTLSVMALLKTQNLGKRIDGKWVLWDVNLEVGSGEILGVLGRSDSGKTTLARIIMRLDQPTNGVVTYGEDAGESSSKISAAFRDSVVVPELSVYENLSLFTSLWGASRKQRGREIAHILEMLLLSDSRSKRPAQLSSGAGQRLELARALVAETSLVLIDGLLDTLDTGLLEKVWEYMLEQRRAHDRSFLVLTASGRVAEMCGRLAVISRGKIGFVGKPEDFRRLAGDDMVVLGELSSPMLRTQIEQRFSVVIREDDGFLSFRVCKGEKVVSDLLAEFGPELGCVYLRRPRLEDALDALSGDVNNVYADTSAAQ